MQARVSAVRKRSPPKALEDPSVGNAILAALIGGHVGQRNLATANAYSHVLADEAELYYAWLLGH